jgi:hypothetical protein
MDELLNNLAETVKYLTKAGQDQQTCLKILAEKINYLEQRIDNLETIAKANDIIKEKKDETKISNKPDTYRRRS